jgi:hypothetical protein
MVFVRLVGDGWIERNLVVSCGISNAFLQLRRDIARAERKTSALNGDDLECQSPHLDVTGLANSLEIVFPSGVGKCNAGRIYGVESSLACRRGAGLADYSVELKLEARTAGAPEGKG